MPIPKDANSSETDSTNPSTSPRCGLVVPEIGTIHLFQRPVDPFPEQSACANSQGASTQVKLIVQGRTQKVQGCVIIGNGAAEVINLAALAIQSGVTARELNRLFLGLGGSSTLRQKV